MHKVLSRTRPQPNIIFIVADDLRYDALGYLNQRVRTPNLDRLARDGVRFHNMFVTTSIGAISRASIFTGMYARRHGICNFTTPLPPHLLRLTYPVLLQSAGYRTGFLGNYGVGNLKNESGKALDAQFRDSDPAGFDVFENYGFSYYLPGDTKRENHIHKILGAHAEDFIASSSAGQPFCLSLSFVSPHDDIFLDDSSYNLLRDVRDIKDVLPAEPDLLALYEGDDFPAGPLMNEEYFQALPAFIRKSIAGILGVRNYTDPLKRLEFFRRYYALVSGLDRVVGRIVSVLERTDALPNTVIVLTSDNGYFLGDYGLHEKSLGYEPSIRVPLMIRPAATPISRDIDAMALNIDLAPTLLAMAGVPIPPQMQGRDLTTLWTGGSSAPWRTDFLYEHFLCNSTREPSPETEALFPSSEGVRNERYTYLRYPYQDGVYETLFDRVADPNQLQNIIHSAPTELLAQMRKRTDDLIALNR